MRSLSRFATILRVLIRYRLDDLLLSTALLKNFKPLLYLTPWHYFPLKKHSRAVRIRLSLEALGPIFIKFGQVLSTRRDLLPDDISDELAKLQDSCPPFDSNIAKKIIEDALENDVNTLFSDFDPIPLASASIAQVHAATTLSGEKIIIKVVRPDVAMQIRRDIDLLFILAKFADWNAATKLLRATEVVAEFERIIFTELNMLIEAANAATLAENFSGSKLLYVPRVFWDLCRPNLLVIERIYGTPISDIKTLKKQNIDLKRLAEDGVRIFFTQVFKHNFFHADMHPGNIFVDSSGHFVGVDFGIMGSLTDADQDFIAQIFLAFFNQNYRGVANVYIKSGWVPENTNLMAFEAAIRSICEPMFKKPLAQISFGQVFLSLLKEAKKFNISVQPQLLLLDKTLLNIEGLGRSLYPDLDLWATAKPLLEQLTEEKYNFKNRVKRLKKQAPSLLKDLPELPILALNALKQIDNLKPVYQQKTDAIIKQLKQNGKQQNRTMFFGFLLVIGAIISAHIW